MWYLISHVRGVRGVYIVRFDIIKFNFNCWFKVQFRCFNIAANYISNSHILKALLKWSVRWRNIFLLFSDFWLNLGGFSLITLVSSERRSVSDLWWTSSFPTFFNYYCCFYINCFSYFSLSVDREIMSWSVFPK